GLPGVELGEIREILDDIIKDDKRAADVIHHLRALIQRKERGAMERVNLNEIVGDVERLTRSERAVRDVDLELSLQQDLPEVMAGRVELQQVMLNLMVNAMDAMQDLPAGKRQLIVSTTTNHDAVMLTVLDSGPGVPDEIRQSIFQPFYTTKQHGLGMGLAICKSIVEAHEGRLICDDQPDGGAAFRIEFPRLRD
ncbi:MAG TPA: ATP-binding protein, partial [Luteolibacter sp.]|nr:ATP-binding protein [Luteolibacter sp.]